MSIGGKSLHKKDYLNLALLAGGVTAGFGAAGMGPLAGLLGGQSAGMGAAAAGAAPGEATASFVGTAAQLPSSGLLAGGKSALKGLDALQRANQLVQLAQGPQVHQQGAQPRPQPAMPMHGDAMRLWQQIYGGAA